jgi:WD40 repeat protein
MLGRTDLYGDPLPEGALARIGTARFRPANTILAIAFSPNGRTLAAAGHEGIHLLDASTGKTLARFTSPKVAAFRQVAFLPRGKYLVAQTHEGRILLWELTLGRNRPLRGPETDKTSQFALSGDGERLIFIKDGTIRLWDVKKGEEVGHLPRRETAYRLSFSSDGKLLASLGGGGATLWDVHSGKSLRQFPPSEEDDNPKPPRGLRDPTMRAFALSPNGKILAGFMSSIGSQNDIRLWETATGKTLHVLRVIDHTTRSMAFSPDGNFLALASQNHLQVWDARTGETRWHIPMYGNQFFSVCFSPDGRFIATGLSVAVKIWETATGRERCPFPEYRDRLSFATLSADGRTVLTAEQATGGEPNSDGNVPGEADLRYWDAASGTRLLSPPGQEKRFPPFAALSADQRTLVSWGAEKSMQLWDMESGKKLGRVSYERVPSAWAISDDGKLLVLGTREPAQRGKQPLASLVLWDARTGKRLGEFKGQCHYFGDLRFSPDSKMLASLDHRDRTLHLWEVATRKELLKFKLKLIGGHLTFSRDSHVLAIAGLAPEIVFLEASSGKELPKMPPDELTKKHPRGFSALLFSPDGKRLVTTNHAGNIFIWDRETGRLVKEWQTQEAGSRLVLSAGGKVLLTQGAFTALVWNLDDLLTRDYTRRGED